MENLIVEKSRVCFASSGFLTSGHVKTVISEAVSFLRAIQKTEIINRHSGNNISQEQHEDYICRRTNGHLASEEIKILIRKAYHFWEVNIEGEVNDNDSISLKKLWKMYRDIYKSNNFPYEVEIQIDNELLAITLWYSADTEVAYHEKSSFLYILPL
jgi:hypothetical protein